MGTNEALVTKPLQVPNTNLTHLHQLKVLEAFVSQQQQPGEIMTKIHQFDNTMQLLHKVLDLRSKNQEIIGSNIANAETPGFSSRSFTFEEQLKSVLSGGDMTPVVTRSNHIPLSSNSFDQVTGTLSIKRDTTGIGDENSVSVDQEMIKLSENEILYEAAIAMLNKKLAMLKYAASGGA